MNGMNQGPSFASTSESELAPQNGNSSARERQRRWPICLAFAILGGLALTVDLPISEVMVEQQWPGIWRPLRSPVHRLLEGVEPFGQSAAVISVSLGILLCSESRRGKAFRVLAVALGSGLFVDILKTMVARDRPHSFHFTGSVLDTFRGFFPGVTGKSAIQSWPSGHTGMAVGFCLALSTIYPRGRVLFAILAGLVALHRIEVGAHYLSDTLFGTAVAIAVWAVVFGKGRVGRWFDRIDTRFDRQSGVSN